MQFWRDSLDRTFAGNPPREPICLLLRKALDDLSERADASTQTSIRYWLLRVLKARERYMGNRPFPSLETLEDYAENTYSGLMYATLAAIPMRSLHVDHLASHIGKACGIVAALRGIPVLAAPSPPVESHKGKEVSPRRDPVLLLPLQTMAEAGVSEEDVFRQGPTAPGFKDAVFKVATRANDHLITAREMMKNLQAGRNAGHDFEHEGEEQHVYEETDAVRDMRKGFGVLLEAVPADDYLIELEKRDFDPFAVRKSWKLPWRIWRSLRNGRI
jgi:NADH dehydrogenase [ubiquinone] 1 alpha subcomplex assembly factor 6